MLFYLFFLYQTPLTFWRSSSNGFLVLLHAAILVPLPPRILPVLRKMFPLVLLLYRLYVFDHLSCMFILTLPHAVFISFLLHLSGSFRERKLRWVIFKIVGLSHDSHLYTPAAEMILCFYHNTVCTFETTNYSSGLLFDSIGRLFWLYSGVPLPHCLRPSLVMVTTIRSLGSPTTSVLMQRSIRLKWQSS